MPSLEWNSLSWGKHYKWLDAGEEWSERWGGSEAQWFGSLYPRLHRFLPAKRILEIAPGYGRWTKFLLASCSRYLGIDLNENCEKACKALFKQLAYAKFATNDGYSLEFARDGQYDFVFSFDSLVHVEIDVLRSYIPQIVRKLTPRGVAFLHHSNLADAGLPDGWPRHGRAESVSARLVSDVVNQSSGTILVQEVINWLDTGLIDCLTTFGRAESFTTVPAVFLKNPTFLDEAGIIRNSQSPYSRLPGPSDIVPTGGRAANQPAHDTALDARRRHRQGDDGRGRH